MGNRNPRVLNRNVGKLVIEVAIKLKLLPSRLSGRVDGLDTAAAIQGGVGSSADGAARVIVLLAVLVGYLPS
jgi:hypothetical protein